MRRHPAAVAQHLTENASSEGTGRSLRPGKELQISKMEPAQVPFCWIGMRSKTNFSRDATRIKGAGKTSKNMALLAPWRNYLSLSLSLSSLVLSIPSL